MLKINWNLSVETESFSWHAYAWAAARQNQQNDVRLANSDKPVHTPNLISLWCVLDG